MVIRSQCGGASANVCCNEISSFVHTTLVAHSHYASSCQETLTEMCYSPFTVGKHNQIRDVGETGERRRRQMFPQGHVGCRREVIHVVESVLIYIL